MKFKTDFHHMELLCGDRIVTPIHPGKIPHVVNVGNDAVKITDATYEGFYTYPIDGFAPSCGRVTLRIFSEKKKDEPTVKVLAPKTLARVWADFEPWRAKSQR